MFQISLPIRILGQLGYKYLDIFKRMFPHLHQRKFTRIDDFYELIVCCQTYQKILANSSIKLLLCRRLIGFGNFHSRKEHNFFMTMINRIYRDLNPLPNSGSLVPRLITRRSYTSVNSIKFHEIYPIMAVASSSCFIWQIKSDNTFEFGSSLQNLPTYAFVIAVAFHRKFPILAASLNDGNVLLVEFNIDGTNPKILNTISIQKGTIWSIVFHPILPIVYVSNEYGYLMVLQFTPDFRRLLRETLLRLHSYSINGIAIQRQGRFLATCSDDYTVKILSFDTADCTKLKTEATFSTNRRILCIDIHPTLDLVAIGSDDQYAKIWQIGEDFETTFVNHFYHPSGVRCVQFDHLTLITGCYDGCVRIWNFKGIQIHKFSKPTSSYLSLLAIGFSPNRPRILAIGDINEVTISELEESKDSKN